MITAENIGYKIGPKQILADVSAAFDKGKVSAILSPNGAGKSTLLKCLTGSLKPDTGSIFMDGKELQHYSLADLSRKRAVLSQANPISFPFTALEIVLMGRNPYELDQSAALNAEIAMAALDMMDAWHLRDRSFPTLSGGEQQRVQFARVASQIWEQEGAYLFLDEPTSALDLKHQHQLLDLVQSLCRQHGLAVIIVMHDLNLAYHCTDHCYFIKDGRIQDSGESRRLINAELISEIFDLPLKYAGMRFASQQA
ncbi:MAG: heme ABC transporter ATP-binding protein [Sneathiella sp.]